MMERTRLKTGSPCCAALGAPGFSRVLATPHTRPGLFDNTRATISEPSSASWANLPRGESLPELALSSEHYFDEVVFQRLLSGQALPIRAKKRRCSSSIKSIFRP